MTDGRGRSLTLAYLGACAVLYAGVGVGFAVAPAWLGTWVALDLSDPVALTDVRAVYGGYDLAFAGLCVVGLAIPAWRRFAVVAAMAGVLGLASGRLVGLAVDGVTAINVLFLAGELTTAALGGTVLWTTRAP